MRSEFEVAGQLFVNGARVAVKAGTWRGSMEIAEDAARTPKTFCVRHGETRRIDRIEEFGKTTASERLVVSSKDAVEWPEEFLTSNIVTEEGMLAKVPLGEWPISLFVTNDEVVGIEVVF